MRMNLMGGPPPSRVSFYEKLRNINGVTKDDIVDLLHSADSPDWLIDDTRLQSEDRSDNVGQSQKLMVILKSAGKTITEEEFNISEGNALDITIQLRADYVPSQSDDRPSEFNE